MKNLKKFVKSNFTCTADYVAIGALAAMIVGGLMMAVALLAWPECFFTTRVDFTPMREAHPGYIGVSMGLMILGIVVIAAMAIIDNLIKKMSK